jgi:hypothetical protein
MATWFGTFASVDLLIFAVQRRDYVHLTNFDIFVHLTNAHL